MSATGPSALQAPLPRSAAWPARARRALRRAPLTAKFGLLVVLLYVAVALFAPLLAPFAESEVVGQAYLPWGGEHLLGTDHLGRDMLSRMLYGARNTIGIALATTALAFLAGGALGLLAAVVGGWVDQLLSRLVDLLMAVPHLIFTLVLLTIFGSSVLNLILIIAALDATRVFRLARATGRAVAVLEFVEAARLQGERLGWIMAREVLPNVTAPLVAEFGLRFCFVFLTISALAFLGLGLQPPTADWGSMVRENATLITYGDVTPLLPAGAIALLAVAVNFLVDWLLHLASGLKDER